MEISTLTINSSLPIAHHSPFPTLSSSLPHPLQTSTTNSTYSILVTPISLYNKIRKENLFLYRKYRIKHKMSGMSREDQYWFQFLMRRLFYRYIQEGIWKLFILGCLCCIDWRGLLKKKRIINKHLN